MTHKERYVRLFRGESVDGAPFYLIMPPSRRALERWQTEGLEVQLEQNDPLSYRRAVDGIRGMFGFDTNRGYTLPLNAFVWPEFDEEIIEELEGFVYERTKWGSIKRAPKKVHRMALQDIPPVTDWRSWEPFKELLKADTPGRLPDNSGRPATRSDGDRA